MPISKDPQREEDRAGVKHDNKDYTTAYTTPYTPAYTTAYTTAYTGA